MKTQLLTQALGPQLRAQLVQHAPQPVHRHQLRLVRPQTEGQGRTLRALAALLRQMGQQPAAFQAHWAPGAAIRSHERQAPHEAQVHPVQRQPRPEPQTSRTLRRPGVHHRHVRSAPGSDRGGRYMIPG